MGNVEGLANLWFCYDKSGNLIMVSQKQMIAFIWK